VLSVTAGTGIQITDDGGGAFTINSIQSTYVGGFGIDVCSNVVTNTGVVSFVGTNDSTDAIDNGGGNWTVVASLNQPNKYYAGSINNDVSLRSGNPPALVNIADLCGGYINTVCQSFAGLIFTANMNYYTDNTGSGNQSCAAQFICCDTALLVTPQTPQAQVFISAPDSNPGGANNRPMTITITLRYGIHYSNTTTSITFGGYVGGNDSRLDINNQGINTWSLLGIN
jgi:hypothetical protein